MATESPSPDGDPLARPERRRLASLRSATGLADLVGLTDAETEHEAYLTAKGEWRRLRGLELDARRATDGLPGPSVTVDGVTVHVHGVTHADTGAERAFLREHLAGPVERGAAVYCEQGIRPMYFQDWGGVCAMDDYRWAMAQCRDLDADSHLQSLPHDGLDALVEDLASVTERFREATFSLIDAGSDVYGERVQRALGDVATDFLQGHEGMAVGDDFASFALTRRAATDPSLLSELYEYYARTFLPQPVEREWLRGHDPELELVTHARNERMADYAVAHVREASEAHLVVGAAHVPGVRYYLQEHRDGDRDVEGFSVV